MRKIVQIAAVPETQWNTFIIYALCDDGTVWTRFQTKEDKSWCIINPIPQDPQPELTFVEQRDRIAEMLDRSEL